MKRFLFTLIIGIFTASASFAETTAPKAFAEQLANEIMKDVVLSKKSVSQKRDAFRRVFLQATDIDTISRFTLGRYYKTATDQQRADFKKTFTDNVILTWTGRFSSYAGEKINFQTVRQDKKDFYVNSTLDIPNTENDIEIIWRITNKNEQLKLADMVVEGVSMILSYRNEYTSVLQQNDGNIQKLIDMLNEKNKALQNPPAAK